MNHNNSDMQTTKFNISLAPIVVTDINIIVNSSESTNSTSLVQNETKDS